jgi:hypothetical protein
MPPHGNIRVDPVIVVVGVAVLACSRTQPQHHLSRALIHGGHARYLPRFLFRVQLVDAWRVDPDSVSGVRADVCGAGQARKEGVQVLRDGDVPALGLDNDLRERAVVALLVG